MHMKVGVLLMGYSAIITSLIVLKATGIIPGSVAWWVVMLPLTLPGAMLVLLGIMALLMALILLA